jgi:hypothetical protein
LNNTPEFGGNPFKKDNTELTKLAWFAGILEGEGSISLIKPQHRDYIPVVCRISITNTDLELLCECQRIIASIIDRIPTIRVRKFKKPLGKKTIYNIDINKQLDVLMILETIQQFLVGIKKQKSAIVIEFLQKRIKLCIRHRSLEFEKFWKFYAEKFRGVETKWSAPEMGDDIVRPNEQSLETDRNVQFLLFEN